MRQAERLETVAYALYSMRKTGERMIGAFADGTKEVQFFESGGLYPGKDGGLGFCAIPRRVLEAVGRDMQLLETGFSKVKPLFALKSACCDWPQLYEELIKRGLMSPDMKGGGNTRDAFKAIIEEQSGGWYSGEDIAFFQRVRAAGFSTWVDTRIRIAHKGAYKYMLEDVQVAVPRAENLHVKLIEIDTGRTLLSCGAHCDQMTVDVPAGTRVRVQTRKVGGCIPFASVQVRGESHPAGTVFQVGPQSNVVTVPFSWTPPRMNWHVRVGNSVR